MKIDNNIHKLKEIIDNSNNIVFFGGAGVSTESGIPDFRSKDGLYNQCYKYPPEMIISHSFFMKNTVEFYKFYREKMNCLKYEPNITHKYLVKLENEGKLNAIITQNIDGLHQKAGSKNVLELHGSVLRNYCMKCNKFYDSETVFFSSNTVPHCQCGGIIKPDVVLYEEELNEEILREAIERILKADCLIIGGTSLSVYPAAGLIKYYNGNKLVLINKDETVFDYKANLCIHSSLGKIFDMLQKCK